MAKEAKKIGKEARIVYATGEGTRVATTEKAVEKLIEEVGRDINPRVGATILERLELEKIPLDRFEIKNIYKGEEANKIWAKTGYTDPPYVKRMIVLDMKLTKETKFVRVYIDPEKAGGQFVTLESEIKDLTAKEIQKKFALPYTPKYVSETTFKPGTEMRAGLVNENFEQPGLT